MMSASTLREALTARPFRPFVVHVVDGRTFEVPDPKYVSISPGDRSVLIWDEDEGARILDLPMITRLEIPEVDTRPAG